MVVCGGSGSWVGFYLLLIAMDDLTLRWSGFHLTDEESLSVVMTERTMFLTEDSIQMCVMGKLFSSRKINLELFRCYEKHLASASPYTF